MAMFHNAAVQLKIILLRNRLLLPPNRMNLQPQSYNVMTILPQAVAWKRRRHIKMNITLISGACITEDLNMYVSSLIPADWLISVAVIHPVHILYSISDVSQRPVGDMLGRCTVILKHPPTFVLFY